MKPTKEEYRKFIQLCNQNDVVNLKEMLNQGFQYAPIIQIKDSELKDEFFTLFLVDQNSELFRLIHEQALKEPVFIRAFEEKGNAIKRLFKLYIGQEQPEFFEALFKITNYRPNVIAGDDFYPILFQKTWKNKINEHQEIWMRILENVSVSLKDNRSTFEIIAHKPSLKIAIDQKNHYQPRIREVYKDLFDEEMSDAKNKEQAIKIAIAGFYDLLSNNTQFLISYLQYINDEFVRYCQFKNKTKFPEVNATTYDIKHVYLYLFPFPNETYIPIKQKRLLGEFLELFFRQHGQTAKLYKFHGFVPKEMADNLVEEGNRYLDGQLGIGLFHGKYSHAFQEIFLKIALANGIICNEYQGEKITSEEINRSIIKKGIWTTVRDQSRSRLSFVDPFRINSVTQGKALGLGDLQNVLLDNFCVVVNKLYATYNAKLSSPIKREDFYSYLSLYEVYRFFTIPEMHKIQSEREQIKKSTLFSKSDTYIVVESDYKPDMRFSFKSYADYTLEKKKPLVRQTSSIESECDVKETALKEPPYKKFRT